MVAHDNGAGGTLVTWTMRAVMIPDW